MLVFAPAGTARAGPASDTDYAAIRTVIKSQLDAFRRDDEPGAFQFNTPALRRQFGTTAIFARIVREAYPPIYGWQAADFGRTEATEHAAVQLVFVVGEDGRSWRAIYSLERQPNGSWLISGCRLEKDDARAI